MIYLDDHLNAKKIIKKIEKFSNETNSHVTSSDHEMVSGRITNVSLNDISWIGNRFNPGPIANDFHLALPNQNAKPIWDLTLRLNGTFLWQKEDNNK